MGTLKRGMFCMTDLNNMNKPLSFDEWVCEFGVESLYENLQDEYGDAVGLLSLFKEYRYKEYLEQFEI